MLPASIQEIVKQYLPELVAIRRHIHQYPELSFQEYNTAAFIRQQLTDKGIAYEEMATTATIAYFQKPNQPTLALRADIDALPIHEKNTADYSSKIDGIMHACGHDVHTTCLLGTLWVLKKLFPTSIIPLVGIFQLGEEKLPGGASILLEEGLIERFHIEKIVALHVEPAMPVGNIGFASGDYMASADEIYWKIKGKGGHGAMPDTTQDTVLAAAELVVALQKISSRLAPPSIPTVLTIGKFIANGATNIIPAEVCLEGTFRTMNESWRMQAHEHIQNISASIATMFHVEIEVTICKGYPVLINDDAFTTTCIQHTENALPSACIEKLSARMTSEDFAFYSQLMPACFFRLGTRNETKNIVAGVHTPLFDIDEEAIQWGIYSLLAIVLGENKELIVS